VRHRFLGLQAMKVLRPDPMTPSAEALLAEARLLVDLLHSHIVRVYDANEATNSSGTFAYITMEHLPGGTLSKFLAKRVRLPMSSVLELGAQLLSALEYAHGSSPPLIHRDITPGNVLVSGESPFSVKLADFGLAGRVHPETRILRAAGTIRYLPPEAAYGFATELGDLYAVALLMYEALTGAAAFPQVATERSTAAQLRTELLEAKKKPPLPPSRLRAEVPRGLDDLLLRALEPDSNKRFRTATEFLGCVGDLAAT
jgi:eukaryotic-like serine/threonine-protein kinase